jgi:hypothetical protein
VARRRNLAAGIHRQHRALLPRERRLSSFPRPAVDRSRGGAASPRAFGIIGGVAR